jgi:hypothetical protein
MAFIYPFPDAAVAAAYQAFTRAAHPDELTNLDSLICIYAWIGVR